MLLSRKEKEIPLRDQSDVVSLPTSHPLNMVRHSVPLARGHLPNIARVYRSVAVLLSLEWPFHPAALETLVADIGIVHHDQSSLCLSSCVYPRYAFEKRVR